MRKLFVIPVLLAAATLSYAQDKPKAMPGVSADTARPAPPKKPAGIQDKVKSSRKIDGLFTLYQDTTTGNIQLYVKKNQLGKEFIYQSFALNGPTSMGLNRGRLRTNLAFRIQKVYDRVEFAVVNTNFYYDKNNAISKTQGVDVPESIFYSDKVSSEDENGYLINGDALFMADKLDPVKPQTPFGLPPGAIFTLGGFNPMKSKYNNIKSYPSNTNVVVDMAYDNPMPMNGGGKDITDARYVRVCVQHSFVEMPENDYRPRRDDPRVGYFMNEINDQTNNTSIPFKDVIRRWHLVKKDPSAALSEPVEPIVWWVENTTPVEYRDIVIEAGNKWNEAFEKAGFKNAIVMKVQPDNADWDAGDIRYNVIKWVSSPYPPYGAIGMHSVNPKTGQIIAGDIIIEWASGSSTPLLDELYGGPANNAWERHAHSVMNVSGVENNCAMSGELREQFVSGLTAVEAGGAADSEVKEMHKQFLYYLIMHEMGHTLGLNHNMRSSTMLKPSELNNKDLTRKIGLMNSVMDYPATNIALDKTKQGDYYTTKAGPYDLWAIEYGYTPCAESEEKVVLEKILSRSTDPQLAFGNDADDMRSPGKAIDPRVNVFDMSADAIGFAETQFQLIKTTMTKIKERYSKPGGSYAELRSRYNVLNNHRFNMASSVSRYVGGVYVDRSFVGQQATAKPLTPVPLATQKKAIEVLNKYVFAPDAFNGDEQVFAYLQLQRRGFNFFTGTEDPKLTGNYTGMQTFGALSHILHPTTLQRITNTRLYGNQYSVADVMGDLTKGIFNADLAGKVNVYRQYLQTQYVRALASIVEPQTAYSPYDDVSKAGALYTLKKIRTMLTTAVSPDEETKAHRSNLQFMIEKALKAD